MARYGDLDKLAVKWRLASPTQRQNFGEIIESHPTDDVVPRADVEAEFEKRLAKYQDEEKCIYTYDGEIWDYCVQGPCPHHKVLKAVRQEVAREIFEEIDKLLYRPFDDMFDEHYQIGERDFAELKKKYTEV